MDKRFLRNVLLKGLALFLVINLLFIAVPPGLGKLSLYNRLFPGRERFPFGENPAQSYNLSLFDLDAMFAAHAISAGEKPADEYRVVVIGDSSIWGTLLRPEETLPGLLDAAGLETCAGRQVRVYNLGYPTISLTKDLLVLDYSLRYQPDLILWGITMEAFPKDKQLASPIVANNAERVRDLFARHNLLADPYLQPQAEPGMGGLFDPGDPAFVNPTWWDRTLIGQRRSLADLLRLQLYGAMWAATGIDQVYSTDYTPAQTDFDTDIAYHGRTELDLDFFADEVLQAGMEAAGDIPVILFNEPMLISTGENSDLRLNFFYPRWAYGFWLSMMAERAGWAGWTYLDLDWIVPPEEFTNSAIHMTPAGERILAEALLPWIEQETCP